MKQFDKIYGYPPELRGRFNSFITTEFDDSMTVEMQLRTLIKWIKKNIQLTNDMVDYLNDFIKNFDENLYQSVSDILNKWLIDGTITEILNEEIINQLLCMKKNNVYMCDFPRLEGEKDDTQRLQRAVDSFPGNIGGVVNIHETLYISGQITINKTGVKLKGLNNKVSQIISTWRGTSIWVEPLFNGKPYTNTGYCKFYIEDLAIRADGDAQAIEGATGLYLKWNYACLYKNLFVSGFKRGVVLKGSHLNTFLNFYGENSDVSEKGVEIHNRGVALSADGERDEAGETTSNNNTILGGWIHNSSLDFTNMQETFVHNIDIEPASNSIICGYKTVFKECRFERFNYYAAVPPVKPYDKFPWFIVDSYCVFKDNSFHQSGAHENPENPIFLVKGRYNTIEYPVNASYDTGTITYEVGAQYNDFICLKSFNDYAKTLNNPSYKNELNFINGSIINNKISFVDKKEATEVVYNNSYQGCRGVFESFVPDNVNFLDSMEWAQQDVKVSVLDESELKKPAGYENVNFFKLVCTDAQGQFKRIIQVATDGVGKDHRLQVKESGVYTMSILLYVPANTSVKPRFMPYPGSGMQVDTRDRWVALQCRGWFNQGEYIQSQLALTGAGLHDTVYFGGWNVVKGNCGAYFPNDTKTYKQYKFN